MFKKGMTLKEKQRFIEKETAILEHLEEMGQVYVGDIDNFTELIEVLESMNYLTHFDDEHLIFENKEEKEEYRTGEVKRKLLKNKGGNGGYTYRISIPVDFIRELELEDEEEVSISLEDESIVIRTIH